MKILQSTFVRGVAGSEKFLLNAIPKLIEKGHQVEVLVLYISEQEIYSFTELLNRSDIKFTKINIKGFNFISSLIQIGKLLKKFDVVNSHLLHADLTMSLAKRFFAKKTFLVSGKHGYEEWYINKFGFDPKFKTKNKYWFISKIAEKSINKSFAISKGIQNLFIGVDVCKFDKIDLIYYGFEFDQKYKKDESIRFGNPQLCIVGRLTAFKGHRFAIQAVSLLKQKYPNIRLVLVGWGELENDLKQMAREEKCEENIIFTGMKPNPRDYMFTSDIILLPSISEGFGIVLAEAMSVKRPIVAFNVPSPSELLINDFSGILVEPYKVDFYAQAIEQLIKDETKRNLLSENAFKVLNDDYHIDKMVDKLEKFYSK